MLRIDTLYLAGIIGLGLAGVGCIGSGHPREGGGSGASGSFDAAWSLAWLSGGAVTCADAGITTVDLDLQDTYTNLVYHDSFNCSDSQGTSELLPPDDFTVALRAYDSADNMLSMAALPDVYLVYSGYPTPLPWAKLDLQSFSLSWSVLVGGVPASCDQAGASEVELLVMRENSTVFDLAFPCAAHSGFSPAILPGTYSVQVNLLDSSGSPLPDLNPQTVSFQTVVAGSVTRAVLGPYTFSL
jgi:hypothetical protein